MVRSNMADSSLRSTRDALMDDRTLRGEAFCRALSDHTDTWLAGIAEQASDANPRRLVLLAVGGYGRQELCPYSDLDLVLVHEGRRDIKKVADALWYPVWDEGVHVDHAVRRPKEVLNAASGDLRVALGLLDARVVWGDQKVAEPLIAKVRQLWRSSLAADFLPALEEQMVKRHHDEGDVAFLLEPNLKEAHGGLRDVSVLRALPSCAPRLSELVDLEVIKGAASTLTSVRVELHRNARRALDKMLLQEQDAVARSLDYADADALCRAVSEAGRSIARLSDETWRRRRLWAPGASMFSSDGSDRLDVEEGIVVVNGEVTLASAADVSHDASLIWRIGAVAAERDLPIALGAVHRLADKVTEPSDPWPTELRDSLVRLLLLGRAAIAPFESLDHVGVVSRLVPEWEHVRYHHQRNAYHRFTVDRHLLETAANASELVGTVDRPDLLVIGALFHDIGKGLPGDHTELGIELMGTLGTRMGFDVTDVATLQALVRYHLLLADTATRRDLSDPRTIQTVAELVGDRTTLHLLGALTKADSLATGSSAWGGWKEQLVRDLVERTDAYLAGRTPASTSSPTPPENQAALAEARLSGAPVVLLEPPSVVVAAPDRPGLLADVAGTLALNGLDVHAANAESVDGVALDIFTVELAGGRWPEAATLRADLLGVLRGEIDLARRLETRSATYASARQTWSAHPVISSVVIDNDASLDCTIIEVRAADEIGLLHRLTSCLFGSGLDVNAARVATIGGEVIDAFYVRAPGGEKLTDPGHLREVKGALEGILSGSSAAGVEQG